MFTVRLDARECSDQSKIDDFLNQAQTGFLGLSDGKLPYVVPLNFVWRNGAIYFHGAEEGRKASVIESNNEACFTVSENYGTITHSVPAHTDTAYMSVMIFGKAEYVTDREEAHAAMQALLDKYVAGYYKDPLARAHLERYRSSKGSATHVCKVTCESLTAKENAAVEGKMYKQSQTVRNV
ncbi:pyridoxamine 5'-phosphate oxidase family protein [Paenibacillus harenae]|uniref:pyridoxamine 5'-phosphate oxidase family protein n=1 Tax=Paenibacillus harenae TaxID=306543 RepID=UPI0027D7E947|nr:pyridoxamine 5'-phosphate oxidase family protein [Paenibacillus harenae]